MRLAILIILIPTILQAYTKEEWVNFYLRDCKPQYSACKENLEVSLGKMLAYSDITFKYLDAQGLPRWLATIPIVESDYVEDAVSPAGAIGLWQLMPYHIERARTRKKVILGREVTIIPNDSQIRAYGFNPIISTKIATDLLKSLYTEYSQHKDVDKFAIIAYNAGEHRVNKFINSGSPLPQETIDYYNKIMAIQHILQNMKEYGIVPVKQHVIFIDDYLKALVSFENDIETDHVHQVIQYVLG